MAMNIGSRWLILCCALVTIGIMLYPCAVAETINELWPTLSTPLYANDEWSAKDAAFGQAPNGTYAFFFSAFYTGDDGYVLYER